MPPFSNLRGGFLKKGLKWYRPWHAWVFILPALLGLFVFRLGPIIFAFFMSFTHWDIFSPPDWVGFSNYAEMFSDPTFWTMLKNTFIFSGIYVPSVMVIGLVLAVLVNQKFRGVNTFRAIFFSPVVTSAVAIGLVWGWLLSPKYGLLNNFLQLFNVAGPSWLGDPKWALMSIAFVMTWKMAGYYMILFLAGLQDIPVVLYEASRIDGATPKQTFWHVTLPLLSPTTFFVLIIAIIDSFRNFQIIYTMTRGGPGVSSTTLVYSIYQNAFVFYRMGYASAIAYVLLAIVGGITLANFYLKKRWVKYQS